MPSRSGDAPNSEVWDALVEVTSKFAKPITAIALIDTRAASSILDTKVLPEEYWTSCVWYFNSVSGDTFFTNMRTTPITINFFPQCSKTTKIFGSSLPNKDLVIG